MVNIIITNIKLLYTIVIYSIEYYNIVLRNVIILLLYYIIKPKKLLSEQFYYNPPITLKLHAIELNINYIIQDACYPMHLLQILNYSLNSKIFTLIRLFKS